MTRGVVVERKAVTADELAGIDVCRRLEPALRAAIAAQAVRLRVPKKGVIVAQSDASSDIYFLLAGRVRVNMAATNGREITYQLLSPGQMFGEMSAIDGKPRSAGVTAEDNVTLARLDARSFRSLLREHPDFALAIVSRLVSLSRWLTEKVYEYHAYNVKGRICSELLRLAVAQPGADILVTDKDMASRVGTTRENVNRIVGELKQLGIVTRTASSLCVKDAAALRLLLADCEVG